MTPRTTTARDDDEKGVDDGMESFRRRKPKGAKP